MRLRIESQPNVAAAVGRPIGTHSVAGERALVRQSRQRSRPVSDLAGHR